MKKIISFLVLVTVIFSNAMIPVQAVAAPVCRIESTNYESINEALKAANSGDTITLIASGAAVTENDALKSGVKLDMQNYAFFGTLHVQGGTVISNSIEIIGPASSLPEGATGAGYRTDDGKITVTTEPAITISDGTFTVLHDYGTNDAYKSLTLAPGAVFIIPQSVTFGIWGNVVSNGSMSISGTLSVNGNAGALGGEGTFQVPCGSGKIVNNTANDISLNVNGAAATLAKNGGGYSASACSTVTAAAAPEADTVSGWNPSYEVQFLDCGGSVISEQWVGLNQAAVPPAGYVYSQPELNWVYRNLTVSPSACPAGGFQIPDTADCS